MFKDSDFNYEISCLLIFCHASSKEFPLLFQTDEVNLTTS